MSVEGASPAARSERRWTHTAPLLLRIPDLTADRHGDRPHPAPGSHHSPLLDSRPLPPQTTEKAGRSRNPGGLSWHSRLAAWWVGGGGTIVLWTLVALATLVLAAWLQLRNHPSIPVPAQPAPTSAESRTPIRHTADWEPPPVPNDEMKPKSKRPVITGLRPYDHESSDPRSARADAPGSSASLRQQETARSGGGLEERMKRAMTHPFGSNSKDAPPATVRR